MSSIVSISFLGGRILVLNVFKCTKVSLKIEEVPHSLLSKIPFGISFKPSK